MLPLGEADVKFPRYAQMFPSMQVHTPPPLASVLFSSGRV
jgi:hypothetical protein